MLSFVPDVRGRPPGFAEQSCDGRLSKGEALWLCGRAEPSYTCMHTHTHTHSSHARLSLSRLCLVARTMRRPAAHIAAPRALQLRCCSFLLPARPHRERIVGLGCVWGGTVPCQELMDRGHAVVLAMWYPMLGWSSGAPTHAGVTCVGSPPPCAARISYHLVQRSVGPGLGAGGLGGLCVRRTYAYAHTYTHTQGGLLQWALRA